MLLVVAAPARAEPTLADLVEVPDLSGLSAAPDGHAVVVRVDAASIADNSYRLAWWALDPAGRRPPRRLAEGGRPIHILAGPLADERPQWSSDSRWFYYRALGGDGVQVWRTSPDDGGTEPVTHDPADVIDFRLDPATGALAYHTGEPRAAIIAAEDAEYDAGVVIDSKIEPGQALYHGMRVNGRMADQRLTGKWFDRGDILADRPRHLRTRSADGTVRETADAGSFTPDPTVYAPEAETLAVDSTFGHAYVKGAFGAPRLYVRGPNGQVATCSDPICQPRHLDGASWTTDGRVLFQGFSSHLSSTLALWDPRSGRVTRVVESPGSLTGGSLSDQPCVAAAGAALCIAAGPASPPQVVVFDLRTRARRMLFDPSAAVRDRVAMRTEALSWTAAGRPFTGVLFLPVGASGPAPLFLQYYSCEGYLRGGTGDEYPMAALAAAGFAALCVNQTGTGATPDHYDALDAYDLAVTGLGAIIDQLAQRGLVNPNQVGMGGLSFGSEVTMRMLTTTTRLSAAAISSTEVEPIYWWYARQQGPFFRARLKATWGLAAPDETAARWKQVSPALNADRINTPLLMQTPEQESRYNYELLGRLQARGVPVEMVAFPDEAHIKAQPRHKLAVYQRNLDWFRFWLQGVVDPDLAKAAQYARWRALRDGWAAARAGAPPPPDAKS